MKNIYKITYLAAIAIMFGCTKDLGNYDYVPKELITIKGIESTYSVTTGIDKLSITPSISSTDPKASFEYFWGVYNSGSNASGAKLDTIAHTQTLDYLVAKEANTYTLVFGAKNKNTGFTQYIQTPLTVGTPFTSGWYVIKDDGSQTDADFFRTPALLSYAPIGKTENAFSLMNGRKLDGKALQLGYLTRYNIFNPTTQKFAATKALFLQSEKEAAAVSINSLKGLRNFNELFMEPAAAQNPNLLTVSNNYYCFMANAQLYQYTSNAGNTGVWGARVLKDAANTPYHLSKYAMTFIFGSPIFFDETSSSFLQFGGTYLDNLSDDPTTDMPSKNTNKNLLFMGTKTAPGDVTVEGYAVLQDKSDLSKKIISHILTSGPPFAPTFKFVNQVIDPADPLYNASHYGLITSDEQMLYFSVGNTVYSRNLVSNVASVPQFTAPVGEEVTFIRHRKLKAFDQVLKKTVERYNYVIVGTKVGANYKVRVFTKSSGNLNATPEFTMEGTGNVSDVYFVNPEITDTNALMAN